MGLVSITFERVSADNDEDGVIFPVAHIVERYADGRFVEKKLTCEEVGKLKEMQTIGKSHEAQLRAVLTHMGRKNPESRPFAPIELKLVS